MDDHHDDNIFSLITIHSVATPFHRCLYGHNGFVLSGVVTNQSDIETRYSLIWRSHLR